MPNIVYDILLFILNTDDCFFFLHYNANDFSALKRKRIRICVHDSTISMITRQDYSKLTNQLYCSHSYSQRAQPAQAQLFAGLAVN